MLPYVGMSYFPDISALVYNNQGPLYKRTDGTSSWSQIGTYPQGSTNNISIYSPKHPSVFFGGGNGSFRCGVRRAAARRALSGGGNSDGRPFAGRGREVIMFALSHPQVDVVNPCAPAGAHGR